MFLNIYKKEMKDCFRDRRTLFLTVFLPVLMMTGLIFFYENLGFQAEEDSYTLAVHSSFSSEEKAIFSAYDNIEFNLADDPEAAFAEGEADAALLLDDQFTSRIAEGSEATVTILGDSFSQNSSSAMNIASAALAAYEKEVVTERLEQQGTDPSIVQPFTVELKETTEDNVSANLLAILVPLILVLSITIGSGPAALDLFAGEKEKKTMEALLMTPVKRSTLLFSKWLTITTIGALIGIIALAVMTIEITFFTENLKGALSLDENGIPMLTTAVLISIVFSMFNAAVLMLTSIMGKTIKESQSYTSPISMLFMLPLFAITSLGVNEFTFKHFAIPILNLFTLLKELLFGIVVAEHILLTLGSNLICVVIVFIICRIMFMKDKWVIH